jgi:sporulation-control protein spo0M
MGFFDKIKGAVGIGQPKLDFSLSTPSIKRGETLEATLSVEGQSRALPMKNCGVSVYLHHTSKDSNGAKKTERKRIYRDIKDLEGTILEEGDTHTWSFNITIPSNISESGGSISYTTVGFLDVPGMDPEAKEKIIIL